MNKFTVFFALIAVSLAADAPPYPKPAGGPAEPLMPYEFGYTVKDDATYNNFAHQETANTQAVSGSYRVSLPDGRTQIVTYKADEYGYVADVKYEGEAKYPEPKPSSYPPVPQPVPPYKSA